MNKKSQFFLISTVAMAIGLAALLIFFTVPYQLTVNNLHSQSSGVESLANLMNNFHSLTDTLYYDWPAEQTVRTSFSVYNSGQINLSNEPVIARVQIKDYAALSSFELRSESGVRIEASFCSVENGSLIVSFLDSLNRGETKNYNVFYNVLSDEKTILETPRIRTRISEDASTLSYESPYYRVVFSKNTGAVTEFSVKGDPDDLASNFYARARTGGSDYDETSMTASLIKEYYYNNAALLQIDGELTSNVNLTQHYCLLPEAVILYQDFSISAPGTYNLSYVFDTTTNLDSLVYDNNVNISLNQPGETSYEAASWHAMFKNNTGINAVYPDNSYSFISTGAGMHSRIQLTDDSYSAEKIRQDIIIIPYYNNYTAPRVISPICLDNPLESSSITKSFYSSYASYPITSFYEGYSEILTFDYSNSKSEKKIVYYNDYYSNIPAMNSFLTSSNIDYDTLNITKAGIIIPSGVTTKNYNNDSHLRFRFKNNSTIGIAETFFKTLSIDGEDFTINVEMNSGTINDELLLNVYSPNSTLIASETLSPSTPGSFETKNVLTPGFNVSGVYLINISGDNVLFSIGSGTPLVSASNNFILYNEDAEMLYFEAGADFSLNISSLDGTERHILLNNTAKLLLNESTPFYKTVNHSYSRMTPYYLFIPDGLTLIKSSLNFGIESCYLNERDAVKIVTADTLLGKTAYDLVYESSSASYYEPSTNLSFDSSAKILQNKDYDWDLDSETLAYKNSNNWLYSGDFYACTGEYGACGIETTSFAYTNLLDNTALFKTASFTSGTIIPILTFYNDSNLIKIELVSLVDEPYIFGINFRINGDDDLYFKTSFTPETALDSEIIINSTGIKRSGWFYVAKKDSTAAAALFVNSQDVKQGFASAVIDDDYLRVGLDGFGVKTLYFYIGEDWLEIENIEAGLNHVSEPINYPLTYSYSFAGGNVQSSGTLIG